MSPPVWDGEASRRQLTDHLESAVNSADNGLVTHRAASSRESAGVLLLGSLPEIAAALIVAALIL